MPEFLKHLMVALSEMRSATRGVRKLSIVAALAIAFFAATTLRAADTEGRAITNAIQQFEGGFYSRAEVAFSNFSVRFPESPQLPQALLYEGRAVLEQGRFGPAIDILSTNAAHAGALADLFQYWLGRAQFAAGNSEKAAEVFAQLNRTFTNSAVRLEAALGEVEARLTLRQWQRAAEIIDNPSGGFQSAAVARGTNDPVVARGYLMLARAWLQQRQYVRAEQALGRVSKSGHGRLQWERQLLLCRSELAMQRLDDALVGTSNLVALARPDPQLTAAAVALQAEVLSASGRPADALKAYELNLGETVPDARRREAFLKIIQMTLEQNNVTNAIARTEKFLAERPADAVSDVAWLAVGELRLKQYQLVPEARTNAAPGTNVLDQALESFDRMLHDFPKSGYIGKAQLDRGWTLLAQGKPAESATAFQAATNRLEHSEDLAVACFKLADLQFQAGDNTNAIQNYRRVIHEFTEFPRVQRELVDQALYQVLHASRAAGDRRAATEAIQRITNDYPSSPYADRGLLLFLQMMNDFLTAANVRNELMGFLQSFPSSPLVPRAKLAIARTYERENNWVAAAAQYSRWAAEFPANDDLPEAEFSRALATFHAGNETNALKLFTNFVTRFVTNELAARAQNWVGDYYFRRGMLGSGDAAYKDFVEAERNYQLLYTSISSNWPASDLTYQAQLKAGRAAFRQQKYDQAIPYFTNLAGLDKCPASITIEAIFAYGDTFLLKPSTNALERFRIARNIFAFIPTKYPADPQVPRAWGRMANCSFQSAGLRATNDIQASTQDYLDAYELYRKVTNSPVADTSAIAQAHIGMGDVRRRQAALTTGAEADAFLKEALDQYLDIVYSSADERPDALWVKDAALLAAQLCEDKRQWSRAIELYTRVADMIPPLRPAMEKRASDVRLRQSRQSP